MNSPPTPPYCGSVAAALHLMNAQIRCGSCQEKVFSGFCLSFVQILNNSCSKKFSPLMPINFLINCLINFWTILVQSLFSPCSILVQFLFKNKLMAFNESNLWTLMFQKGCAPGKRFVFQNSTLRNTASWEFLILLHDSFNSCARRCVIIGGAKN